MTAFVSARNVGYRAGQAWLVRDASLDLVAGSLTAIIGPNGAGKSTLLRLISGDLRPTTGTIVSLGMPLDRLPPWHLAARRVVMAQASHLAFPFRVHEVVAMGCLGIGRKFGHAQQHELVESCLAAADLLPLADREFQTLSGGEQQRTQLARALCQLEAGHRIEPRQVLLLDEPIASLDLEHQFALLDKAKAIASRKTRPIAVAAVLHDLNLAACYADILVVMQKGKIVAQGRPQDILTEAMLAEVFGVRLPIIDHGGRPAILPHMRGTADAAA